MEENNTMKPVVSPEIAEKDVMTWLDKKRIGFTERDQKKKEIKTLIGAVVDGTLALMEDGSWKHKLVFPVGSEESTTNELVYKHRLTIDEVSAGLKGFSGNGADLNVWYSAMLTEKPKGVLKKMDSSTDYKIMEAIAGFFQ